MAEGKNLNPIAELVGSFVKTWFRIREIDRVANIEISKYMTLSVAIASAWVGISWGMFAAYTVGQETIDLWLLISLIALIIATNLSLVYLTPKLIDKVTGSVTSASDAAIIKVINEEFPAAPSETTSTTPPAPPPAPPPTNDSPRKSP